MRLDLFLKTGRLVKRRSVAKEMCEEGRVLVNGREAQPAKEVRPGDRVMVRYASRRVEVEIILLPGRPGRLAAEELYRVISETRLPRTEEQW